MDMPEFGPLLRQWRLRAGLTQEELAGRSGLSSRAIRELERGRVRQPRLSSVRLLADSMELTEQERKRLARAAQPAASSTAAPPAVEVSPPSPPPAPVPSGGAPSAPEDVPPDNGSRSSGGRTGSSRPVPAANATVSRLRSPGPFVRVTRSGVLAAACVLAAVAVVGGDGVPAADSPPAPPSQLISYVARVSNDVSPAGAYGSVGTGLLVEHPVARGDSLLVTVRLINAQPGPVTVTDTAGNTYTEAGETTDADGDRLLILTAVRTRPLRPGRDRITLTWPASGGNQVTVDEFHGITAVGSATGTDSGHGTTRFLGQGWLCAEAERGLLVSAVASYSDLAVFGGPWEGLPDLTLDQYRLATRYRLYGAENLCLETEVPMGPATRWEALAVAAR